MKYVNFNGDKLSKLSLGTVQFGLDYGISNFNGKPTQENANQIVEYVSQEGINCFDTAQAYGNSEQVLGIAIEKITDNVIISKVKSFAFRENVIENVNSSVNNLGLKSLFGLLLHDSEILYKWTKEDSKKVEQLKEIDKIKYFGVSIYTSEDFDLAIKNEKIELIQIPFNLFDQRALKDKWFQKAKESNKLIFIRSIYLQGLLLMNEYDVKIKLPEASKFINKLDKLCNKYNCSRNELCLSFVDNVANDSLLLFGCDNISQAKENILNYNNLKVLDNSEINEMHNLFIDIPEAIYNPTKWK